MLRLCTLALATICVSCAPIATDTHHFGRATPLCQVIASEQSYAGQHVLVAALLVQTPHGRELNSPECNSGVMLRGSSETWDVQANSAIEAALAKDERARIPVVVQGIFRPWTRIENGQPIINVGGPVIDDAKVVAARQP